MPILYNAIFHNGTFDKSHCMNLALQALNVVILKLAFKSIKKIIGIVYNN